MSRLRLVAVLATVTALGGCSPTSTWAVKPTPTGLPQFVDNACDSPKGDQNLAMSVQRENAGTSDVQFTLDGLRDGKVHYEFEYLTADEFAKKRVSC